MQEAGYGEDQYSKKAKMLIRQHINDENADIHFVSGGTQANLLVISSLLKPYQCAIAASSGHILNNETGAIESTGHKIISVPSSDGKLRPEDLQNVLDQHQNIPHQVMPKLVYISNSTELGTIYNQSELVQLSQFCREKKLILFMDGARLAQALTANSNDLTLKDIAAHTDIFYLGGTKNGALFGEAIIILNDFLKEDFAYNIKQKGALLAKGRVLGIQFLGLMQNDLYFQLGNHANHQAQKIKTAMTLFSVEFYTENLTNQLFPIISNKMIAELSRSFDFYTIKQMIDSESVIRIITSWNTPDEAVNDFIHKFGEIAEKYHF